MSLPIPRRLDDTLIPARAIPHQHAPIRRARPHLEQTLGLRRREHVAAQALVDIFTAAAREPGQETPRDAHVIHRQGGGPPLVQNQVAATWGPSGLHDAAAVT